MKSPIPKAGNVCSVIFLPLYEMAYNLRLCASRKYVSSLQPNKFPILCNEALRPEFVHLLSKLDFDRGRWRIVFNARPGSLDDGCSTSSGTTRGRSSRGDDGRCVRNWHRWDVDGMERKG